MEIPGLCLTLWTVKSEKVSMFLLKDGSKNTPTSIRRLRHRASNNGTAAPNNQLGNLSVDG